jgi:hypothetical protein
MQSPDALPAAWQRLLALSGVAFAVLFLVGWFASGGDAPDYAAADQEWTEWADDNQWRSRIGGFAMLLAGFVFLHLAGTIRSVLGTAETTDRGSAQLARVAFAGALIGIAGMTTAIVMIAAASSEGADANPVVSRAVTTASAGPFLVSAMGFAALLMAAGLLTLRSGVFARWVGIVAFVGAISFLITFLALIAGTGEDSVFGFGFFPGVLALVIWSIATSMLCIARWRPLPASSSRQRPTRRPPPQGEIKRTKPAGVAHQRGPPEPNGAGPPSVRPSAVGWADGRCGGLSARPSRVRSWWNCVSRAAPRKAAVLP